MSVALDAHDRNGLERSLRGRGNPERVDPRDDRRRSLNVAADGQESAGVAPVCKREAKSRVLTIDANRWKQALFEALQSSPYETHNGARRQGDRVGDKASSVPLRSR